MNSKYSCWVYQIRAIVVDDDSTISSYIPFRHKHILFSFVLRVCTVSNHDLHSYIRKWSRDHLCIFAKLTPVQPMWRNGHTTATTACWRWFIQTSRRLPILTTSAVSLKRCMATSHTATTMWARLTMTSSSSAHIWSIAMVRRRSTPTPHSVADCRTSRWPVVATPLWTMPIHTMRWAMCSAW